MYYFDRIIDEKLKIEYPFMLRCENMETLQEHDSIYMRATINSGIEDYFKSKFYTKNGKIFPDDSHQSTEYGSAIDFLAKHTNYGDTAFEICLKFENQIYDGKVKTLKKYGGIYLRTNGSYMPISEGYKTIETIENEKITYPQNKYTEKDIRIKRWDGGKHYYAKIKDIDVVNEYGEQKWNTVEYAELWAKRFLKKLSE